MSSSSDSPVQQLAQTLQCHYCCGGFCIRVRDSTGIIMADIFRQSDHRPCGLIFQRQFGGEGFVGWKKRIQVGGIGNHYISGSICAGFTGL